MKKYKLIILGLFAVIIMMLLTNSKPLLEGLTTQIGRYQYLAPVPSGNTISDDMFNKFADVFKKNNPSLTIDFDYVKKNGSRYVIPEEVQYYIDNGKWPYGSYLIEELTKGLTNQPGQIPQNMTVSDVIENIQKLQTSRGAYYWIGEKEKKMNPQPLSYQIYMGMVQPPTEQSDPSGGLLNKNLKIKIEEIPYTCRADV